VTASPFSHDEARLLEKDAEFQRRVATDAELNRLFNPPPDDEDEREQTARALGSGIVVAGVPLPPPTVGTFRLLSMVNSEFLAAERKFDDLAREVTLALYVMSRGHRAVMPYCEQFRMRRAIERHAKHAKESPAHLDRILAAERTLAAASYEALGTRLGGDVPQRSEDCSAAESALTDDLTRRLDRVNKELGGYGQSLVQAMGEVLRRWPELRADMDAAVDSRREFLAFNDRVANDDLPKFEAEFKDQLNRNAIQELAGFNNWLHRQASAIDDRLEQINEALGAVPYNPGRYIRLEKEPTTNQDVVKFRADLRNLTNDALVVGGDQYSEQRFEDVKRVIERFRGRDGHTDADKAWTGRVTDVRNWFVFSASERDDETHEEWEHYRDSDGKSGGQKEKLAYTILAASLAYQFGLEWGAVRSKDFRFAVIDEAFGRGSDASTRYALELFAKLGLQLLIVTPLQKVHIIEPFVQAIGFVDNPDGANSRMQTMTIEEYRERRDGRAG